MAVSFRNLTCRGLSTGDRSLNRQMCPSHFLSRLGLELCVTVLGFECRVIMINSGSIECGDIEHGDLPQEDAPSICLPPVYPTARFALAGVMLLATPLAHASFQRRRAKFFCSCTTTSYCTSIVNMYIDFAGREASWNELS